ncbi:hypothetical protein Psal006b_02353 [Piscirickettsia salmonis]|uniref:Uncharacterized protein n=1 Tax=Piscirickettsia salmonis TaxID=1238 RepID=A0A1L6T9Z7_PISSA|nr:hypothetical protein [Piscirickettsia salmonis]AKP73327.1 hypothetical protein PSLF89_1397 [Piscirickettsia salmonis LF-89 = ATCC VR-1361]ALB22037.1 hypothetical protein KU39_854 [Piscirickettsia salmonis]ALY02177.1 hypothetical protein AWE47_04340 [Piscirickettsia salmonis]AMA41691.1 hypothetical protein AWJ11_04335 [Piscirickettsia salmonis]AOS34172.1 hypothetical protein AVM72_01570 [Piscirickettsia salmonis]
MSELTFLKIEGNHSSPTQLARVVQKEVDKPGQNLHEHYFDLQGQALVEGQLKGKAGPRKVLVAVDLVVRSAGKSEEAQAQVRTQAKLDFFYQQLAGTLPPELSRVKLRANFDVLTCSDQRFSIIPIHKEMYFHVLRCVNAVTIDQDRARAAFEFAYNHVYQLINADIAAFLNDRKGVRVGELNRFIDQQRVKYAAVAESMVMSHLLSPPVADLREKKRKWLKTHTAADMDFIATNHVTGVLTHVTGCKQSSHSKKDQPAAMMAIDRYALARPDDAKPLQSQVKVPSLKEFKAEGDSITVSQQIRDFMVDHNLQGRDTPLVVYNLLTSLPRGVDSCDQQASAKKIFKGAHHYNATRDNRPMFYVMNLPINQHTQYLYYTGSPEQREALLLADLAMVHTVLRDLVPGSRLVANIDTLYQNYLRKRSSDKEPWESYFSKSLEGKQAIKLLRALKEGINHGKVIDFSANDDVTRDVLLKKALLKLYASKYPGHKVDDQKEYASLAQALFLAATNNYNFKGCKSANERFSYIENLNALLFAFKAGTLQGDIARQMRDALTTYIEGGNERDFALTLHCINDRYNVYNAGVVPSCMDTGTPKCYTKPDKNVASGKELRVGGTNTNFFLARSYCNVSQDKASAVQAHAKKMGKRMNKLQEFTEKQWEKYHRTYCSSSSDGKVIKIADMRRVARAVIADYAEKAFAWGSHFKQEARDFLADNTDLFLVKSESESKWTVEKSRELLKKTVVLRKKIQGSEKFSHKSTFNTRLLFTEHVLQSHLDAAKKTAEEVEVPEPVLVEV